VIGQGIKHQAQVRMVRGGRLDERLNSLVEHEWKKWGKAKNCHAGGTLSWSDVQRLCLNSMIESGEVFIRFVNQQFGDSRVPLGLEILEADFLDDDYTGLESNGNRVRMGVEINEWGRPVAYHFLTYHPGDYQFSYGNIAQKRRIRVPADEIIHLYSPDRPRGKPEALLPLRPRLCGLNKPEGLRGSRDHRSPRQQRNDGLCPHP